MINQFINELAGFSNEDWIIYIQNIRDKIQTTPSIEKVSPDILYQIEWIYLHLGEENIERQRLFVKSLIEVLDLTQSIPRNLDFIYNTLSFIDKYPPLEHRRTLRHFIRNRRFSNQTHVSFNLHLLFIKVYTKIEDKDALTIEEYLLNNKYKQEPYFLYLITFYYAYTSHPKKALDAFSNYYKEIDVVDYEAFSEYIYYTLKDCSPKHIDLTDLLERIINGEIRFDAENPFLFKSIDRFCKYLSKKADKKLAFLADDVLKNKFEYFPQEFDVEYNSETGKPLEKIDELVAQFTVDYIDNLSENNLDDVITYDSIDENEIFNNKQIGDEYSDKHLDEMVESTINQNPKKIANLWVSTNSEQIYG